MKWQELERLVRGIAEMKFGATARAEDIAGVKCDCVLYQSEGSVVIIEISKETTIAKLRTDIAKFNTLRPHFIAKNIFPKCYFVTKNEPTPALIAAGKSNFVNVLSVWQLFDIFLGLDRYSNARMKFPFGSAVNLYSGEPDRNPYIAVQYVNDSDEGYTVDQIATELSNGKTIILVGDYGSGKSRCIQEVFEKLIKLQKEKYCNPISINLRENWGLKRSQEIITRHFTDIGLSDILDDAMKVAYSKPTIYLLDGFDEIGAQTWSDDPTRLVEIRKQSLIGVKDLISKSKGGVLIAGREHYFNNDVELIECLGVDRKSPLFLRCSPQLTDGEFLEFLGRRPSALPVWLPKKPLIARIIRDIDIDILDTFLSTSSGEIDFWNLLIDSFCEREAQINPILDPGIIRALYTKIGRLTRYTETPLGPIPIKAINGMFEDITGRPPTDESAIVLQRLPGLSRIGAESLDRKFADTFILDGLKAEDILELLSQGTTNILQDKWVNPIEEFGSYFISTRIQSSRQIGSAVAYIKRNKNVNNKVILSDLMAALFLCGDNLDFSGQIFSGGQFSKISLSDTGVHHLRLEDCHFEYLDITDSEPKEIILSDCTIVRLAGLTSSAHAPAWFKNCLVDDYQSTENLAAIREAGLSLPQTFLLSSLRKLFFQPGGGRRESSMYKGYGDSAAKRICDKVIQLLVRERFCAKYKGATEPLYVPDRALTSRVKAMMNQLTTSKDPIWQQVSKMSDVKR